MDANEKDREYLMNHKIILALLIFTIIIPSSSAQSPIRPDSPIYQITIMFNDLQEILTFNETHQVILKQQHMASYIRDFNYSNNNMYILEKIKSKQNEMDAILPRLPARHTYEIRNNHRVLGNLLNSTTMPQQSKQGIQNAYNNSMKTIETMNQKEMQLKNAGR